MLESTFAHINGVGEATERMLWQMGCTTWDEFLAKDYNISPIKHRRIKAGVLESKGRLADLDNNYFRKNLPSSLSWRAFNNFKKHACCLDIETTGLSSEYDEVTAVCLHSLSDTKSYISGENLKELKKDLSTFKYIITFNGARFDLPFLTKAMGIKFNQIHLDLYYVLKSLGFSGGLKNIEKKLGILRETDGVTGYDAVRMWRAYKNDREIDVAGKKVKGQTALDLLVEYNREDTVNLMGLTEYAVSEMRKSCFKK